MQAGSFWTQPLGATTSPPDWRARHDLLGDPVGPHLVKPSDEAFDGGERPINVGARNITRLGADDAEWVGDESPRMACLGGSVEDNEQYSTFVEPLSGSGGDYIRSLVILSLE